MTTTKLSRRLSLLASHVESLAADAARRLQAGGHSWEREQLAEAAKNLLFAIGDARDVLTAEGGG